jgi:hypothetical protein
MRRVRVSTFFLLTHLCAADSPANFDVLVYGATSGGVTAAVAAARHGSRVVLLTANGGGTGGIDHIGGMSSSGLGHTDKVNPTAVIGGLAREFYSLNTKHYQSNASSLIFNLEPHVARSIFVSLLQAENITLITGGDGANLRSVTTSEGALTTLSTVDGRKFSAKVFIDAGYEGDLMVASGAKWTYGRESVAAFNESQNGRRPDDYTNNGYEFKVRVDPYDSTGQPLPLLDRSDPGRPGEGDKRVQAYNFRLCATNNPAVRADFPLPSPSSPFNRNDTFELARRIFADPDWETKISRGGCPGSSFPCLRDGVWLPSTHSPALNKTDWNNPFFGPVNTDCVTGCNQSEYPIHSGDFPADYARRRGIYQLHKDFQLALIQFYRTGDPPFSYKPYSTLAIFYISHIL